MSPSPRSKLRFPEEESDRRLKTRLDILIAMMLVQIVLSIGLWIDRGNDGVSFEETAQVTSTEPLRQSAQVEPQAQVNQQATSSTIQEDATVPPEVIATVKVQILNGCGVNGLAAESKAWFIRNGYDVRDVGNADRNNYEKSRILDRSGNLTAARELAKLLELDDTQIFRMEGPPSRQFDLTFVIGNDNKRLPIAK